MQRDEGMFLYLPEINVLVTLHFAKEVDLKPRS